MYLLEHSHYSTDTPAEWPIYSQISENYSTELSVANTQEIENISLNEKNFQLKLFLVQVQEKLKSSEEFRQFLLLNLLILFLFLSN